MFTATEIETANFSLVELIDSYIDMGYEYVDAYEMAMDDYQRQLAGQAEAEAADANKYDILMAVALKRGFAKNEASFIINKVRELVDAGNYELAHAKYLHRLIG